MEATHETQDDPWAWPCPYCGSRNTIESAICGACRAQLRDPEEDDLFTTIATENAQVIDPDAPRVREALWSTEVTPEEEVAEELPHAVEPQFDPIVGMPPVQPSAGPFSQASTQPREPTRPSEFGAGGPPTVGQESASSPFGPSQTDRTVSAAPGTERRRVDPPGHVAAPTAPSGPGGGWSPPETPRESPTEAHGHVTPDENGLSVAVDRLSPAERERRAVPIGVCGALLGEQEVVLGLVAGHTMGHASVLMVTTSRVLISNSRRWKPLLDQFLPSPELTVHLRHDRDVASLTIVSGARLTTLDGISDVAAAMELTERIRHLVA